MDKSFFILGEKSNVTKFWLSTLPSVSLSTVLLDQYSEMLKHRYTLMLILAKALWQFYGTGWMRTPWSTDSVLFLVEYKNSSGSRGIFINEPFIHSKLSPYSKRHECLPLQRRFEAIEAFGVMLLEIELRVLMRDQILQLPREEYKELIAYDTLQQHIFAANSLFGDAERMQNVPHLLKEVIHDCLTPDKFRIHSEEPSALRAAIYRTIVDPILGMFKAFYKDTDHFELQWPTIPRPDVTTEPIVSNV